MDCSDILLSFKKKTNQEVSIGPKNLKVIPTNIRRYVNVSRDVGIFKKTLADFKKGMPVLDAWDIDCLMI